jgi:glycosyltransferase involved in cell wall biosynthesis
MRKFRRVAIFHDWLVTWRGGEKCLDHIINQFDEVEVYTLFVDPVLKEKYLDSVPVIKGLLGNLPFVKRFYRLLLLLFPLDILFLSWKLKKNHQREPYDLLVSISHCAVKNITPPESLVHVCYCLTPMRYIWDQYDRYLSGVWYEPFFRPVCLLLRYWDRKKSSGVTHFIAISGYISQRIARCYNRKSRIVYPPVRTENLPSIENVPSSEPLFLMVNALVPYKNTNLVVESFFDLPYNLRIVGSGPEESSLRKTAPSNVIFLGRISDEELEQEYARCTALIYAAEEDFGIVPVEAQAHGKPVICYGKGGCLETVVLDGSEITGISFDEPDVASVKSSVRRFVELNEQSAFKRENCIANAARFSEEAFCETFMRELSFLTGTNA